MNLTLKLAIRYLKLNKGRSLLTISSVILAVVLFASVGMLITSFQTLILETHVEKNGDWEYKIHVDQNSDETITYEMAEKITKNILVEKAGIATEDKYLKVALIDQRNLGSQISSDYNYMKLIEYDEATLSMFPFEQRILQGRMPKNSDEIIISNGSAGFWSEGSPLGQTINFDIGSGVAQYTETSSNFIFTKETKKTYTIVGVYDRFRYGKLANVSESISINPAGEHSYIIYVKLKPVKHYEKSIEQIMSDTNLNEIGIYESHDGYLRWIGQGRDDMKYVFVAILTVLYAIVFLSMTMVIKNTFSLSYSEKSFQLGILRCIGASKTQVVCIVVIEGIIIWLLAQPIGLALSFFMIQVVISIVSSIELEMVQDLEFINSYGSFLIASIASLVTILLSTWLPAKHASNLSPVEAVRGSALVKPFKIRKINLNKIIERIFGYTVLLAVKNLKRDKARYKATLISLIVSVTLFVTVVGITAGLNYSLENYGGDQSADFYLESVHHSPKDKIDFDNIVNELKSNDDIKSIQVVFPIEYLLHIPVNQVPEGYISTYKKYFSVEKPFVNDLTSSDSGVYFKEVKVLPVSRSNYNTLVFKGPHPTYDEFVQSDSVIISQRETFRKNGKMDVVQFSQYKPGDTITIVRAIDDSRAPMSVVVAAELGEVPWFAKNSSQGYIVVPEEKLVAYLNENEDLINNLYTRGSVAIRSNIQDRESLNQTLKNVTNTSFGVYNGFKLLNIFEDRIDLQNIILIMKIFTYGFNFVVVFICCLNIFNTFASNIHSRKREIAVFRSIGMGMKQVFNKLITECILYSIKATFYGGILGITALHLLTFLFNKFIAIDYQNPIMYLFVSFIISLLLSIFAGVLPIVKMMKYSLVKGLYDDSGF